MSAKQIIFIVSLVAYATYFILRYRFINTKNKHPQKPYIDPLAVVLMETVVFLSVCLVIYSLVTVYLRLE